MESDLDVGRSALLTDIAMCVNYYRLFSPGLYCCVHAQVQLDESTTICPGVLAMVNHGRYKQSEPDPSYQVFKGAPNFVVDVFPAESTPDDSLRRDCFQRAGVIEYVALRDTQPLTWTWNRLNGDRYVTIDADSEGMILSTSLPGFWIPLEAFRQRDWWAIMGAIARGVTRRGHHEFMDSIWNADQSDE